MTTIKTTDSNTLTALKKETEDRISQIENTPNMTLTGKNVYYMANDGDDSLDGRTPETAWKSLDKLNRETAFQPGDVVAFRRGDLWRGQVFAREGVTYTAYGEGAKPRLYGSPEDGAVPEKWKMTRWKGIWQYSERAANPNTDVGVLVCNHGECWGIKCILRREADGSVWNNTTGQPYENPGSLTNDLDFFHDLTEGVIYLRSDTNPGERFSSIEFSPKHHGFAIRGNHVTIDNFEVRYIGAHGVGAGTVTGLTVQNCLFRWIGGSIQAEGLFGRNHATRYGNGVEIYGGCNQYTVENCVFDQIYDAAVTQQVSLPEDFRKTGTALNQTRIRYVGNVMTRCNYSVEYFLSAVPENNPSTIRDFLIGDNLMWDAGFGFCEQRPDKTEAAHIKSWNSTNPASDYRIENNLMAFSKNMLCHIHASLPGCQGGNSMPQMKNNRFCGRTGDCFGMVAFRDGTRVAYDETTAAYLGDTSTDDTLWFVRE